VPEVPKPTTKPSLCDRCGGVFSDYTNEAAYDFRRIETCRSCGAAAFWEAGCDVDYWALNTPPETVYVLYKRPGGRPTAKVIKTPIHRSRKGAPRHPWEGAREKRREPGGGGLTDGFGMGALDRGEGLRKRPLPLASAPQNFPDIDGSHDVDVRSLAKIPNSERVPEADYRRVWIIDALIKNHGFLILPRTLRRALSVPVEVWPDEPHGWKTSARSSGRQRIWSRRKLSYRDVNGYSSARRDDTDESGGTVGWQDLDTSTLLQGWDGWFADNNVISTGRPVGRPATDQRAMIEGYLAEPGLDLNGRSKHVLQPFRNVKTFARACYAMLLHSLGHTLEAAAALAGIGDVKILRKYEKDGIPKRKLGNAVIHIPLILPGGEPRPPDVQLPEDRAA
jgi:hypothetical protein